MPVHTNIASQLERALAQHKAGQLVPAHALYLDILKIAPQHPDTLHLLGVLHNQAGNNDSALAYIRQAIVEAPSNPAFHNSLGVVLDEAGDLAGAVAAFNAALSIQPDYAAALYNLGNSLQTSGDLKAALGRFEAALASDPNYLDARINLANVQCELGLRAAALTTLEEGIARSPTSVKVLFNLANLRKQLGHLDTAVALYGKVIELDPAFVSGYSNYGNALQDQGKYPEAITMYQRGLKIDPRRADLYNNIGNAYNAMFRHDDAICAFEAALRIEPAVAETVNNVGNAFKDQGRMQEALHWYSKASKFNPALAHISSNALLTAQYVPHDPDDLFEEHLAFARQFEQALVASWPAHRNPRDESRRLKVGYISADLRAHAVASFMLPIYENHDRSQLEVFSYYNYLKEDALTARFKACSDHWIACAALDDDELAARIQADGIDILVDLAGHSAAGRLQVFARKPAPVQITYLGYVASTGLAAMDYRLTQADVDPQGNDKYYTEKLLRLPGPLWWCYRPAAGMPEPGPLPALTAGHVTFGSTNNVGKITPAVLALWSSILKAVPGSRLLIAGAPGGAARQLLLERFAQCGVGAERLELHGRMPAHEFHALHARIDIGLDTFPYNGGTTSCDALWLGVPFVALIGESFVARMGYALLKSLGLEALAGRDIDEYVKIAGALAGDLPRLAALRAGLRARVAASALCDEAGFTRTLEAAYRKVWATWCESGQHLIKTESTVMKKFLHIGCGPQRKNNTTPGFNTPEWNEVRLDIDPSVEPDIVGTMTDMSAVEDGSVDAIFSSHNIEHLYPHEVPIALKEWARVLKPEGFVVITCPDLQSVCKLVAEDRLCQPAYESASGPITPLDILYGHRPPMQRGNLYMSHRCGFTLKVLIGTLRANGFPSVAAKQRAERFDLWAVASKADLSDSAMRELAVPHIPN